MFLPRLFGPHAHAAEAPAAEKGKGTIRFNETAGSMAKDSVFNAASVLRQTTGKDIHDFDVHINVIGGGNADNNNGSNTNGSDVNLNGGSSNTGDNFVIVMIAAMIALCGMATVVIIRKRRMASK